MEDFFDINDEELKEKLSKRMEEFKGSVSPEMTELLDKACDELQGDSSLVWILILLLLWKPETNKEEN